MERVGYLGLGSNVGDREAQLRGAIEALRGHGVSVEAASSLYETEPVGEITDQPDFLNGAVRIKTALEPEELLDLCKAIEAEAGRDFTGPRHAPRPIDVDLLLLDDTELATDRLTLPHPEVTSRRFVLETGGVRPGKCGMTRVASSPAGRFSIAGRRSSKVIASRTLGAI